MEDRVSEWVGECKYKREGGRRDWLTGTETEAEKKEYWDGDSVKKQRNNEEHKNIISTHKKAGLMFRS